jgi:predicted nucleic acid-binding protein
MRVVVDTSVVLAFYFPAEPLKPQALALLADAARGRVRLAVPTLTRYELINALSLALRGFRGPQRLSQRQGQAVLAAVTALPLEEHGVTGLEPRMLSLAVAHERSAYDACYVALAERLGVEFVTGDGRLVRALARTFPQVRFLGDYRI